MSHPQAKTIREFLALPVEALPSIRYMSEDDAWMHYASDALRQALKSGERVEDIAGSTVVISADRDGWRKPITIV